MSIVGVNLYHLNPFDGRLFDDVENTITFLITLNLIILGLFFIALKARRDQMRIQRAAARKTARALANASQTLQGAELDPVEQARQALNNPAATPIKVEFASGSGAKRTPKRRKKK
jgi:hypothetical protein